MRKILIALVAALLAGCATGYGYSGYDGRGYGDYYYGSPSYRAYDDYYYAPYGGYGRPWYRGYYGGLYGSWGYPWYGGYPGWYGWPDYRYRPHYRQPHRPPVDDHRPPRGELRAPPMSRPLPAERMPGAGSVGQPRQRMPVPPSAPRMSTPVPAPRVAPPSTLEPSVPAPRRSAPPRPVLPRAAPPRSTPAPPSVIRDREVREEP